MRILGFTKCWEKLNQPEFTTFRLPRKDKDWQKGESVQIVIKPRTKERERLGIAKIVDKYSVMLFPDPIPSTMGTIGSITEDEAIDDGFPNLKAMQLWMFNTHGRKVILMPMNKLILKWPG